MLDRWKTRCYYVRNNFIKQMHLSRNQYTRKYRQRVVGWCETIDRIFELTLELPTELIVGWDGNSRYRILSAGVILNESGTAVGYILSSLMIIID